MYLEHFGLAEPPFKITPATDFFFSGASRGDILDALVYAITDGEGIVKVSGEVGSGKTMLCHMLLGKLPTTIKAIYLANPSMSRDELLYAICDRLQLDLEGKRISVILQMLQNHLEAMYQRGERAVVLVDEAHAMPLDTLEELRLLYNMQAGKHKLLQIVLFGQPELDEKLAQTNMRQLKDRIVHHFVILPLSSKFIHEYLMFRMRTAGYKGPDIFSPAAEKLIAKASQGLLRRVNILADKALLAAFVENVHAIEVRHVKAALRDSGLTPMRQMDRRTHTGILAGLMLGVILFGAAWFFGRASDPAVSAAQRIDQSVQPPVESGANVTPDSAKTDSAKTDSAQTDSEEIVDAPKVADMPVQRPPLLQLPDIPSDSLLQQRLDATRQMLVEAPAGAASIQLFYTEGVRPARMEGFLLRAKKLGVLEEIYPLPIQLHGENAFRVLYGVYANGNEARAAIRRLPQRYLEAFAPTLYLLDDSQNPP